MLGKLLKYELKATSRVFIPLYIAILDCLYSKWIIVKLRNIKYSRFSNYCTYVFIYFIICYYYSCYYTKDLIKELA